MNKKVCLLFMNLLYYLALLLLISMLILPHTSFYYQWNPFDIFSDRVNTKTIYLTVGERYQINVFDVNKRVTYKSSDFKVATVNSMGLVTAFRSGKTIVTIQSGKKEYQYRIYVVKLNDTKIKVKVGNIKKLRVKGTWVGVKWKSSDKEIATVNRYGWVKGKKKGTATLTAEVKGIKLKCKVYVK